MTHVADDPSWLGRVVASRYRLIARLGEGIVADVYLARHVLIDRLSAIKVLRPAFGQDRVLRSVFLHEAKAVNRINHPNIVEITDYGESDETAYLVMEYVPGEPLSRHLGRGAFGWERASHMGLQIALALSRAHEMGVIHRDLKPSNVLVVPRPARHDLVKLTDFGVAKLLTPEHGGARLASTATGLLPSQVSPGYVAPEFHALGTMDARSDLFSLGVVVYEAACGALPYAPERSASGQDSPRRISDVAPDVPPEFDDIVRTLLAPDPADRPRDAFEVVAMFQGLIDGGTQSPSTVRDPEPMTAAQKRQQLAPRLLTMPYDRIAGICVAALDEVRERARDEVRPGLRDDLRQAEELVGMLERLDAMVTRDMRALADAEQHARQLRADAGTRIDQLALERSKALGWAGTIAERSDRVHKARQSGAHSVSAADVMLWEQATLEHEEERTRRLADELGAMIGAVQEELRAANEAFDRSQAVLGAQMEGHVAALRSLAAEVWLGLEALAERFDLHLGTIADSVSRR